MTDRKAFGLLAAAVVLAAAFRFSGLGFYNDDYPLLLAMERAAASGTGLFSGFLDAFASLFLARPLSLALIPAVYSAFGDAPLPYHALLRAFELTAAWQVLRLLEAEGVERRTALLSALLFVLYPNHDAARCWPSGLVAQGGLAATLAGLSLYRRGARAAGTGLFLAAMLFYEASSFLWLLLPLSAWARDRRAGLLSALRPSWPLAAAFAAGAAWARAVVPLAFAVERHPPSLSPAHALKVLTAGFEVTYANRLAHGLARSAQWAAGALSPLEWALFALAAAALGLAAYRLARDSAAPPPVPLLALSGAAFLLGYAPYFFDSTYLPAAFSANNRLNLTASVGGAAFFAWAAARWRAGGPWLAGSLAGAFLLANWASNGQYAAAYALQREVVRGTLSRLPAGAKTVLLYGIPERVGSAVVFESTYDYDGLLALSGARVAGKVGQGRMRFESGRAVLMWYGETSLSYAGLYGYDHASGRLEALPDAPAAEAFAAAARARLAP